MIRFLIIFTALIFAIPSQAATILSPNLFITQSSTDDGSSSSSTQSLQTDFHLGYDFGNLYAGGVYINRSVGDNTTETGFGAAIGYIDGGFITRLSYLLSVSEATGSVTDKGTGILFDIGYQFPISATVLVGPMLHYESFSYTTRDTSGTETDITLTETSMYPVVGFSFMF